MADFMLTWTCCFWGTLKISLIRTLWTLITTENYLKTVKFHRSRSYSIGILVRLSLAAVSFTWTKDTHSLGVSWISPGNCYCQQKARKLTATEYKIIRHPPPPPPPPPPLQVGVSFHSFCVNKLIRNFYINICSPIRFFQNRLTAHRSGIESNITFYFLTKNINRRMDKNVNQKSE